MTLDTHGEARGEALTHGLDLIRQAWEGFDVPRPGQPAISDRTRTLTALHLPDQGIGTSAALDEAVAVLDQSLAQPRPRFFGYIGSAGLESAVLADALASSHDVNLAGESGAAELIEAQTIRWIGQFVGFPAGGGTVTSGGMVSTLTALMAARTRALPGSRLAGVDGRQLNVYASADAHSSVQRAVEVLGLGTQGLRLIPVDSRRRMDVTALADAVAKDRRAGRVPMAIVATAGTTLTGAVDPLEEIADVATDEHAWLHVDGAYGLAAAGTGLASSLFKGLERADSASIDAHKWLYVPKACGVLLVADPTTLTASFRHDAAYMLEEEGYSHPVEGTLEYSRPFRALKLWAALRAHGADAFREAITSNIVLARDLAALAIERGFELALSEPDLSIVPLRHVPRSGDVNSHNLALARAMQADGRVFLTSALIGEAAYLRPCIVNFRTRREDIVALLDVATELGEAAANRA